jgi:hypothetical protein
VHAVMRMVSTNICFATKKHKHLRAGTVCLSSADVCFVGVHEPDVSQQHNGAVVLEIDVHTMETSKEHGASF